MIRASKNFISNLKKQKRKNKSLLFLDNAKIIKDAIANNSIKIECIITSLEDLPFKTSSQVYYAEESYIAQLADTKTPPKVLCIAYLIQYTVEKPKTNFLVLDGLQDPGNIGTLIRTAFASGFEYVFMLECVRKENSKLIRSSAGAVFDSKVYDLTREEFVEFAKNNNLNLLRADMNGENIFEFSTDDLVGVVIGNEGHGASEELSKLCYKTVKIPMRKGIESLNAGVSGAIIMYQINKNKF